MESMDASVTIDHFLDSLDVRVGDVDVDVCEFRLLSCKKPYLINLAHVESIVGEWNKDKTEYGVRVYYASGNNFWFGGAVARDFLSRISASYKEEIAEKFDKVARGA